MTTTSELQHPEFSLPKTLISAGILLVLSFGLSYLYGVISSVMPWIYLNVVCTVFLGTALGYASIFVGYMTKQIHKASEIGLTVFSGVTTWYFSWVAYILHLYREQLVSSSEAYFTNFILIFQPWEVFGIISEINQVGLWQIGDAPINGWPLTFIWLVEGLIIMAIPVVLVFKQHKRPFSATHNKWYREYILDKDFGSVYGIPSLETDLQANPVLTLEGIAFGKANQYTQVSIYYLAEEGTQYLSLFDIRIDREDKTEKNEIIHMLEISSQDAKTIMDMWRAKKSFIPFL